MYQVDMARRFPYHDNQRSATLLAYLADTEVGGETEFMLAEPRPVMVRPREGVAIVWSNCVLEDRPASDTWEPDYNRCRAGVGDGCNAIRSHLSLSPCLFEVSLVRK